MAVRYDEVIWPPFVTGGFVVVGRVTGLGGYGKQLEQLRKKSGRTQQDVARELGLTGSLVSLWEHEKRVPQPKHWRTLGRLYNVTYERMANLLEKAEASSQTPDLETFLEQFPPETRSWLMQADPNYLIVTHALAEQGCTPEQMRGLWHAARKMVQLIAQGKERPRKARGA